MAQHYPGTLITFEGIDGAGKTELLHRIKDFLRHSGYEVVVTKEPGGTHIGRMLKKVLLEEEKECDPRVEYLLFAADRAEHFRRLIIPALENGAVILCDRMADSAVAYQGYGRSLDVDFITRTNAWAMRDISPDLTFYLRVPYSVALERRSIRAQAKSTMEREEEDFWHRVIAGYDALAQRYSRIAQLDATQPRDTVLRCAQQFLTQLLQRKPEISRDSHSCTMPDEHRAA